MSATNMDFRRGAVRPIECLQQGWEAIKGQYWLLLGITVVGLLIGGAVPLVVIGPMMCGIHLCMLRRLRGEPVSFDMLFKGFDYFVPGLVATLIQVVPVVVLVVGSYVVSIVLFLVLGAAASQAGGGEAIPFVLLALMFLVVGAALLASLAISTLFAFAYPLVVDRKLSGWEASKASARAALGNVGGVIGLMLLSALLGLVGALFCIVGVYFVMPISIAAWAAAYQRVFPPGDRQGASPYLQPPMQYTPTPGY